MDYPINVPLYSHCRLAIKHGQLENPQTQWMVDVGKSSSLHGGFSS
jgi:hypothetical protein